MKTAERLEARRLRREEGGSVKEIAKTLGVARSTVSLWVRDIELTADQHAALLARNPAYNRQRRGRAVTRERGRLRRRKYQLAGRRRVRSGEPLFVAGCMLYWGEGDKARGTAGLSNSDPEVIRLFGRFLRECFQVTNEQMRVSCYLFADHLSAQREIEQFWLDVLELPRTSLRKSIVNNYSRSSQRKRKRRLRYGTCKLVVYRTKIVQAIYGAIQEFGGFNRPEWLDC